MEFILAFLAGAVVGSLCGFDRLIFKGKLRQLYNRDILARLYPQPANDAREQQRRSSQVTRLIRLMRGHGILERVPHTHRYQIRENKRANIQAVLLARDPSPDKLATYKNVVAHEESR